MEKTVRSQQVIKWQLILSAVVCAIVAFCVLPSVAISADAATETVEYVDRVWNAETGKVEEITSTQKCTVLDEEQCDKDLNSGWYVLNSSFTYKKHVNINANQDVKIILQDGCTLTATKKGFSVKDGATLTIYGQSNGTGKLDLDGDSGDAGLRVGPTSILNIKGGTIRAEGTSGGAGIGGDKGEAAGLINIYGGTVTADSGKKAYGIGGEGGGSVNIYGGKVEAIGDGKDYDIGDEFVSVFVSEKAELTGTYKLPETKTVEYVDRVWNEDTKQVDEITNATDEKGNILTDENGNPLPLTHECTVLTEDMLGYGLKGWNSPDKATWYVLDEDITVSYSYIYISGDVNIILQDGCELDNDYQGCSKRGIILNKGATLTIYGQEEGTGKILVDGGTLHEDAGIGVPPGTTLNIKGGTIEASGTEGGAGIGGLEDGSAGTVNIYGGTITAEGSNYGAGIGGGDEGAGGNITIYGGTVNATGGTEAAGIGSGNEGGIGGTTTIYGGEVTAKGGEYGAGIGGGDESGAGTITINNGIVNAIGGKKACGIGTGYEGGGGSVTIDGGTITATKGEDGENDIGNSSITFIHNSGTINGKGKDESEKQGELTAVKYKERVWDGSKVNETDGECKHYTKLTKGICKNGLTEGWYVLDEDITVSYSYIYISGDVNIILQDGCTLYNDYQGCSKRGIILNEGATLTIYGQSAGTGKIIVDGGTLHEDAGIGVPPGTTLNIKGGTIEASGTEGGAGIGGLEGGSAGTINIYGGTVTAIGSDCGAGIGGGAGDGGNGGNGGTMTIYGGTVTATGGAGGAGIGGGNAGYATYGGNGGTITIYGGTVTATGGGGGAGIGGGYGGSGMFEGGSIGGDGGETTISGGTVTATGGYGGAGIGGGHAGGNGGKTTISGGTVTATGGGRGAGIGGGEHHYLRNFDGGNGSETTISGGTVTATGGEEAAGIGGGSMGNGGKTTISGGTVTATGGEKAAGIGGGNALHSKQNNIKIINGNGGETTISGGTVTATGGEEGENIGHGKSAEKSGTTTITGGSINGYSNHTITLEGVSEEVEVVDINCEYGINDVYTLDKGKLYFYMSDDEYEKLTHITVKYENEKEEMYYRTEDPDLEDPDLFKKQSVNITGVEAQNGVYNGLPQQGYTGTPTNEQGYNVEYDITYYLSTGEKTTPENSGAEGEGKAPVYAGEYKVVISVPSSNKNYGGYCELEFKVAKAKTKALEPPTLRGTYGTAVKDMSIGGGLVISGNETIVGGWEVTDSRKTDIPEVGTTESYEVTFTPDDERNYNTVTEMVVPIVIEIPTASNPTMVADSGKNNIEKLIQKLKEKLSDPEVKDKLKSLLSNNPDFRNKVKEKFLNSKLIGDEVKSEVRNRLSDLETRKRIRDKILTSALITNPEIKERLKGAVLDPDVKNKLRNDITISKLIEDEEVREKLLSLIEE